MARDGELPAPHCCCVSPRAISPYLLGDPALTSRACSGRKVALSYRASASDGGGRPSCTAVIPGQLSCLVYCNCALPCHPCQGRGSDRT